VEETEGVVKVLPVPSDDPPVEAAYQLTVPAEGVAARATVPVLHRLAGVLPLIVGRGVTVATTAVLEVLAHPFAVASAWYVVVEEIEGVLKVVPVPSTDPPLDTAYQFTVPADAVASSETVPAAQRPSGEVLVIVGIALTVAVTAVLEALVQPLAVASA
jgi:hypothetical protein